MAIKDTIKALIISDSRIGHQNQSIALCRWMNWDHIILPVKFRFPGARGASLACDLTRVRPGFLVSSLANPYDMDGGPDVVIATGSRTYYAAKVVAARWRIPSIAILNPGILAGGFDAIIVPDYENSMPRSRNLIKIPVNLSVPDEAMINESLEELNRRLKVMDHKYWGIIVGGENKTSHIDPEDLRNQLLMIRKHKPADVKLLATSSRRSGPVIEKLLAEMDFELLVQSSRDHYNPIPAFTRVCDRIFVTSDSASMISEVVTSGTAAVEILMNRQKFEPNKFQKFINALKHSGHLHVFDGSIGDARKKIDLEKIRESVAAATVARQSPNKDISTP